MWNGLDGFWAMFIQQLLISVHILVDEHCSFVVVYIWINILKRENLVAWSVKRTWAINGSGPWPIRSIVILFERS